MLGAVQVTDAGQTLSVAGMKPRALLTVLALHPGEVVSAAAATELLWGDNPPSSAAKALLTHISTLRQALKDSVVSTGGGWMLAHCGTDVERYLAAVRAARAAMECGRPDEALYMFDDALSRWRGGPQLPDTLRGAAERRRWLEEHATTVEDRVDALLGLGMSGEIVGELEAAAADEPLRERRWGQLLVALYRAGRQSDALRAYQRARNLLAEETGVEPGEELRRLEAAIATHDASLVAPKRVAPVSASLGARDRGHHQTRYARSGDLSIAYQVSSDGPIDVVCVPGLTSNVELFWEMPAIRHLLERLGALGRVITFDKRGTGLSDRTAGLPTLEERADDIRAVMDAAGSESCVLYGLSEGGQAAMFFAATHPERVTHLVLQSTSSGVTLYPEEEQTAARATLDFYVDAIEQLWGQGFVLRMLSGNDESVELDLTARFERNSATPRAAADVLRRSLLGDATAVLPAISAPTLVMGRTDDPVIPKGSGELLAAAVSGARYVELPGAFHLEPRPQLVDDALDEVERFVTEPPSAPAVDRRLSTVLFTDIVHPTDHSGATSDPEWGAVRDAHEAGLREEIRRHRGCEMEAAGVGLLGTFDGPARAVRCAAAVVARARALGLEVRAGVHTGEVELCGDDIAGIAVRIGARILALAEPSEVLVSSTVRDLTIGSGLEFMDAGSHVLDGVPGEWSLLRVG